MKLIETNILKSPALQNLAQDDQGSTTPISMSINTSTDASIENASSVLKNDGLVAIPTETVYGLAGNAFSKKRAC